MVPVLALGGERKPMMEVRVELPADPESEVTTVPSQTGFPDRGPAPHYPAELACDVTIGDGKIHVRPIRPDDAAGLVEFHRTLSAQSIYRRFFSVHPTLSDAEIARFTRVDYVDRFAFVAEDGDRVVAVGRYDRSSGSAEAEVAFVVADQYQHHGIGTTLLERLADAAWKNGITTFVASTLPENREMLHVFADSGFRVTRAFADGIIDVRFPIEPDDAYRAACAARRIRSESSREQDDPPAC
jgi:GNAT superfamily N-acetyltransferase